MRASKIELMHAVFGKKEGCFCRDCTNFVIHRNWNQKNFFKCKVYGDTDSEASDWRKKYEACGMFNRDYNGRPVIELRKHCVGTPEPEPELDGQMTFETGEIE